MKNKVCMRCQKEFDEDRSFCLNCGGVLQVKQKIINCKFEYKCSLKWENLPKQENESIRFCTSCQKNVYFAHSQSELDELAEAGKCVVFNQTTEENNFIDYSQLMGVIVPPPEFLPPPERIQPMGIPLSIKKISLKKKSWWQFWK